MINQIKTAFYSICKPKLSKSDLLYNPIYCCNILAVSLALTSLPYAFIFYFLSPYIGFTVFLIVCFYFITVTLNAKRRFDLARINFITIASVAVLFYSLILGENLGIQNLFIALSIAPIIICSESEKKLKTVLSLLPISLFFLFSYLSYIKVKTLITINLNQPLENILYVSIFTIVTFVTYLMLDHFSSSTRTAESHLLESLADLKEKEKKEIDLNTKLENSLKKLQNSNQELEKAYKNLKDTQEKESKIKVLLEEAEKTASMLHLMNEYNHEIKSPWAVILSGVENPKCSHQKLKEMILKQFVRVDITLDTMINILKGNRKQNYIPININTVIENVMDLFQLRAIETIKNLGNLPNINGDLQDLQILFVNLFKNTIEAMAEEKHTVLIVTRHQKETNQIYIQITDTGKGIPESILSSIQDDEYITSKEKGGGIGLMVVKRIIRQHNGTFNVLSKKDLGSVFTIMFPTCEHQS